MTVHRRGRDHHDGLSTMRHTHVAFSRQTVHETVFDVARPSAKFRRSTWCFIRSRHTHDEMKWSGMRYSSTP